MNFEQEYLLQLELEGRSIVKISQDNPNAEQDTILAMSKGSDIIYQARLVEGTEWSGWADFVIKVDKPSLLGDWSYEVLDAELATETRAGKILYVALYSERIGAIQGLMPEFMHVKNPDTSFFSFFH